MSETKISQFDIRNSISNQNIFRLHISVNEILLMNVLQSVYDFEEICPSNFFTESFLFLNIVKKLSSRSIFVNHINNFLFITVFLYVLSNFWLLVHFQNIWMTDQRNNFSFFDNSFLVSLSTVIIFHYFQGKKLIILHCQFYFCCQSRTKFSYNLVFIAICCFLNILKGEILEGIIVN